MKEKNNQTGEEALGGKIVPTRVDGDEKPLAALTFGYAAQIPEDRPLVIDDNIRRLEKAFISLVDEFASLGIQLELRHQLDGLCRRRDEMRDATDILQYRLPHDVVYNFAETSDKAVPERSRYRPWYVLGSIFGVLHTHPNPVELMKLVPFLQDTCQRLPQDYAKSIPLLQQIVDLTPGRLSLEVLTGIVRDQLGRPVASDWMKTSLDREGARGLGKVLLWLLEAEMTDAPPPSPTTVGTTGSTDEGDESTVIEQATAVPTVKQDRGGTGDPSQGWRIGYLGLEFHDGGKIVRRAGKEVNLAKSRLRWEVLIKLERSQLTRIASRGLAIIWQNCGRTDDPGEHGVSNLVFELNKCIQPLGIRADYASEWGYTLVEIEPPSDPLTATQAQARQTREPKRVKTVKRVAHPPRRTPKKKS